MATAHRTITLYVAIKLLHQHVEKSLVNVSMKVNVYVMRLCRGVCRWRPDEHDRGNGMRWLPEQPNSGGRFRRAASQLRSHLRYRT